MKKNLTKLDRTVALFGEKIIRGDYPKGTLLPTEADLCKVYEISRATLREVIKVLSAKKLIDTQKQKGILVLPREEWNYLDADVIQWVLATGNKLELIQTLLETRRVVEPAIAEWAAMRATGADLAEMESALNEMAETHENKERFNHADIRFHQALIASAHNYVIKQMGEAISTLQRAVFDVTFVMDETAKEVIVSQHRELFDAIRLKNAKVARKISAVMIESVENSLAQKRNASTP